jgi:hypothetical protein
LCTSKVILFKECLEFKSAINLCYSQYPIALQNKIPSPQTWPMVEQVNCTFTPIITQCVMNQFREYWLLFNALAIAISMYDNVFQV